MSTRRRQPQSYVFLDPSQYPEGLPTVLLEASASGGVIVAYPVACAEELIQDWDGGWLVNSVNEAATVLADLAAKRERVIPVGERVRSRVRVDYAWPHVADLLLGSAGE